MTRSQSDRMKRRAAIAALLSVLTFVVCLTGVIAASRAEERADRSEQASIVARRYLIPLGKAMGDAPELQRTLGQLVVPGGDVASAVVVDHGWRIVAAAPGQRELVGQSVLRYERRNEEDEDESQPAGTGHGTVTLRAGDETGGVSVTIGPDGAEFRETPTPPADTSPPAASPQGPVSPSPVSPPGVAAPPAPSMAPPAAAPGPVTGNEALQAARDSLRDAERTQQEALRDADSLRREGFRQAESARRRAFRDAAAARQEAGRALQGAHRSLLREAGRLGAVSRQPKRMSMQEGLRQVMEESHLFESISLWRGLTRETLLDSSGEAVGWLFILPRYDQAQRDRVEAFIPLFSIGLGFSWLLYSFALPWWVYLDARTRTTKAIPLALFVFMTNFIGWLTYLVIRPDKERICPACDSSLDPGFRLCPCCGWSDALRCRQCGRPARADWRFCPFCEAPRPDDLTFEFPHTPPTPPPGPGWPA